MAPFVGVTLIADPIDLALPGVLTAVVFEGVTAPLRESTADNPERSRLGAGEGVTPARVRLPNAELVITVPLGLWVVRT